MNGCCWMMFLLASALGQMAYAQTSGTRPTRVMCIGDSITAGGSTFKVYQEPLLKLLAEAGYHIEFVGSQIHKTDSGELRHEGYGSHSVEMIAPKAIASFEKTPADVVLIHSGHNHFIEEKPIDGIIQTTEEMITAFRKMNPKVKVLLAKVILSGKLPKYSYIPDLNVQIEKLCEKLSTNDSPVVCVDQADGWDWNTDTIADKTHPNAQGADKMARRWFAAFEKILPVDGTK